MRIQVVHNQDDFLDIRIHDINKILDFFGPIQRCSVFPDTHMMCAAKRFNESEILQVPFLAYSESTFLLSPGRITQESLASPSS